MKNIISKFVIGFFMALTFSLSAFAQGELFRYESAGLSMTVPDNWLTREHILLLLMPKAEDLTLEVQLLESSNFSEAVKLSEVELKSIFPLDTSYVVDDVVINRMPVKKIDKISGNQQFICYIVKTPEDKIVEFKCKAPKNKVTKYRSDLTKIIQSIKPNE